MTRREPFIAWPGWPHLRFAALLTLAVTAAWVVLYGGASVLTAARTFRVPVHFEWEKSIPFVATLLPFYLSINLLLWLSPFVLRERRDLAAFAKTVGAMTLVAAACFLAFPAQPAYPDPGPLGAWAPLRELAVRMAMRFNMLPSLHVAMTVLCLGAYVPRARGWQRSAVVAWGSLVILSTVLTHQHHVLDAVTGAALGAAGLRFVFHRRPAHASVPAARPRLVLEESVR